MIDIFHRQEDVHTGVAVRVFGVHADEVTAEMRRQAKVINFGILYGMGVNALRANLGGDTTRAEAQEFLNAYFSTFTELAEYLAVVKEQTRQTGYTTTMLGRRRYFPSINSRAPHLRAQAERMAINAPVQGTAADVIRIAMNQVYRYSMELSEDATAKLLLQVHDELVLEVKETALKVVVPELIKIMESVLEGQEVETHGVPIKVAAATGSNWGSLQAWKNK
jgi:DNA polymerase-1